MVEDMNNVAPFADECRVEHLVVDIEMELVAASFVEAVEVEQPILADLVAFLVGVLIVAYAVVVVVVVEAACLVLHQGLTNLEVVQ